MESEDNLVQRAKEDPTAFGRLYERYVDKIYSYIFHRTGNQLDAEDLTARTFYKALANIDGYTDRGVPISAWLYRIAHNLLANWHRDRSRREVIPLEGIDVQSQKGQEPDERTEQLNEKTALWDAIRRLHPDRQQLLVLKLSEGMTNAEIGQVMGRTEGAIKSLYHRTLVALREDMEEQGF